MGKKTLITLIVSFVVLIGVIILFTNIYQTARNQYEEGHQKSKEFVLSNKDLDVKSIDSIETYNGEKKYHVMSGKNAKNEKIYVWVPQEVKNDKPTIKKQSEGITEKEAIAEVNQEKNPEKIVAVTLGMDEGIPIWEVKYLDKSDRYNFDYVNFNNGDIIKHMAIKNDKNS